jgi:hypothetical protein
MKSSAILHSAFRILHFEIIMRDDTLSNIDDLRTRLRSVRSYL